MKKLITAFALAGFVGLTACAAEDEPEIIEEPVIEEPAPAPIVTEPAPMMTDTMATDPLMTDSLTMPADSAL
jgi:hypothetical protein